MLSAAGSPLDQDAFQKLYPSEFYDRYIAEGIRPDSRLVNECRAALISCGTISTAASSSAVKLGDTHVVAGITLEQAVPGDDEGLADKGTLTVQVELSSLSSADARPGRSQDAAAGITQCVTSAICNDNVLDLRQLCILESQACWAASLHIVVLNNDGGLIDACLLAAIAALTSLQVPKMDVDASTGKISAQKDGQSSEAFALKLSPLAVTFGMHKDLLIVDLTDQELALIPSTITVIVDETGALHGINKEGASHEASFDVIQSAVQQANKRYSVLRQHLQG